MSPLPQLSTTRLLIAAHANEKVLNRQYDGGSLVRLQRGVYAAVADWQSASPWNRYRLSAEALLLTHPAIALSRLTAAHLWGLPVLSLPQEIFAYGTGPGSRTERSGSKATVATAGNGGGLGGRNGFGLHVQRKDLPTGHWEILAGTPVTSLARTLADVLGYEEWAQAIAAADHALRQLPEEQRAGFMENVRDTARIFKPKCRRMRVGEALEFANPLSESAGESLSRANIHALGFPPPVLQFDITDRRGFTARADFYWPHLNLVGEFDGRGKYLRSELLNGRTPAEAVVTEKDREDRIRALGYGVVRWDWDVAKDLEALSRRLRRAGLRPE
ncbi:hypothetical protein [Arthrobacter sp. 35W]|uniref:hypothetical protein n=1 Tax=Arthrobacter sp. 35W TaxID=1132441 RepID=UPI0012DEF024|nr:hypothetical protein [Arthrobacter sp. 35W]